MPAEPATATLPAVAAEPAIATLPAVATDPATAILPAVATEPATATLSMLAIEPTVEPLSRATAESHRIATDSSSQPRDDLCLFWRIHWTRSQTLALCCSGLGLLLRRDHEHRIAFGDVGEVAKARMRLNSEVVAGDVGRRPGKSPMARSRG